MSVRSRIEGKFGQFNANRQDRLEGFSRQLRDRLVAKLSDNPVKGIRAIDEQLSSFETTGKIPGLRATSRAAIDGFRAARDVLEAQVNLSNQIVDSMMVRKFETIPALTQAFDEALARAKDESQPFEVRESATEAAEALQKQLAREIDAVHTQFDVALDLRPL